MPSITRKWRRVMIVGCSHGNRANKGALNAVLRFKRSYRPHTVVHLGDAYDMACLRAGAIGDDRDAVDKFEADIAAGQKFLRELEPNVFMVGNHDERARKFLDHHNSKVRRAAQGFWDDMMRPLRECHAHVVEEYSVRAWYQLGNYLLGHGILYNEHTNRDTAERWGNTVVAHNHRAGMAKGRRADNPTCYTVGTLADVGVMDYAARRPSTLAWSHAIVWGEYCDDRCQFTLTEWAQGETEWRLPI